MRAVADIGFGGHHPLSRGPTGFGGLLGLLSGPGRGLAIAIGEPTLVLPSFCRRQDAIVIGIGRRKFREPPHEVPVGLRGRFRRKSPAARVRE